MNFNIYDDCENTEFPENLNGKFKVWDGSGRFHNYALLHPNVGIGEAFALMATSEDYRDNENVIRFIDTALKKGDAVATGYYSGTLLQLTDGRASQTTRTSGTRSADIDLTWTGSYLDGDFASEIEKVVCENQIAIAPFQNTMTIFSGNKRFMALDNIEVGEQIDTVQYIIDHIDISSELQVFLGDEVLVRLRDAINAGHDLKP